MADRSRFVQSYYTVSAEPPSSPTSYISNKANFDNFKDYAGPGNPPTYVSSVTYGRELLDVNTIQPRGN